jgi:N utilization substance protein B
MVELFLDDSDETPEIISAAKKLLRAAFEQLTESDKLLARHARNWELDRLAMVDRNILRLSVEELLEGETPLKVVINEAIRLAKEFSTAESPRFINGVLDAIAREIAKDTAAS